MLMERGFVTPTSLHYVRNHGAVPRISWEEHRLAIKGLVGEPASFSMDQLLSTFPLYTVLCTLACAGNRCGPAPCMWDGSHAGKRAARAIPWPYHGACKPHFCPSSDRIRSLSAGPLHLECWGNG